MISWERVEQAIDDAREEAREGGMMFEPGVSHVIKAGMRSIVEQLLEEEPVEKVRALYEQGEKGVTARPKGVTMSGNWFGPWRRTLGDTT